MTRNTRKILAAVTAAGLLGSTAVFAETPSEGGETVRVMPVLQTAPVSAPTEDGISVSIDNAPLSLEGTAPYFEGEILMLPLRAAAEALGCTVLWEEGETAETSSVVLKEDTRQTHIQLTRTDVSVSEQEADCTMVYILPSAPVLRGDLTYVPAELFAVLLGEDGVFAENGRAELFTPAYRAAMEAEEESNTEIANPWTTYETPAAAGEALGLTMEIPERIAEHYQLITVRALKDEKLLELKYSILETGVNYEMDVRIQPTEDFADISGDYNEYAFNSTLDMGGTTVYIRGEEDAESALWYMDGNSFAVRRTMNGTGMGMSSSEIYAVFQAFHPGE